MYNLLQEEHLWTSLAFLLFLLIFGKLCVEQIKKYLEHQVNLIKTTINNSSNLLEKSQYNLKNKKIEFDLLEQKLLLNEQKTKENADNFSEIFFENLSLKEQHLKERFNNYLNLEKKANLTTLNKLLVNKSYDICLEILKNNLSQDQRTDILNHNIAKLSSQLSKIKS